MLAGVVPISQPDSVLLRPFIIINATESVFAVNPNLRFIQIICDVRDAEP